MGVKFNPFSSTLDVVDSPSGDFSDVELNQGTAAAPSISFNGDPDTGIYSPGADQVAISTNGTGKLFIDASGRVGVGTTEFTNASESLRVQNSGGDTQISIIASNTSTGSSTINLGDTDDFNIGMIKYDHSNDSLEFRTNNTPRATIDSSGRLGLGTSSPNARLHVVTDSTTAPLRLTSLDFATFLKTTSSINKRFQFIFHDNSDAQVAKFGSDISGSDTSTLQFIAGTGSTPQVTLDSSGRVGIGTTEVSAGLHVVTDVNPVLKLDRGTANNTNANLYYNGTLTGQLTAANADFQISAAGASTPMSFYVNGSPRAAIDTSGRLLVGTTTTSAANTVLLQASTAGSTTQAILTLARGQSSPADAALLGSLRYADSGHVSAAEINVRRDGGTWTSGTSQPTRIEFSTTADGASSPTARMIIDAQGRIFTNESAFNNRASFQTTTTGLRWVAGTSTTDAQSESYAGNVATRYHHVFSNPNGVVGSISTNGSATAYNTSSDYRLKENVVPLTGAADRLNQLQVHRFNFIADPDTTVDGFIAHEAQSVVPECVTGTKDEVDADGNPVYQGIDQSKLVPLLTAALQEALGRIETLEAEVAALKAQ